jgi:hypothetical protein
VNKDVIYDTDNIIQHTALAPCSIVLVEKLTVPHLIKKFPAFHGTQMLITAFDDPYFEPDVFSS